ncbi:hypothetical protein V8E55_009070 [Tylopilus felleus]
MRFSALCSVATAQLALCTLIAASQQSWSVSDSCYYIPLSDVPVSDVNRTVPWGEPTIKYANGTTCCSSLDQVRTALDDIDAQLLQLLPTRMAYVREATRFKSTEADVDNPTRDQQVIQGAINGAPAVHLPQVVAQMVYQSIINSSVLFEVCIFNTYDYTR